MARMISMKKRSAATIAKFGAGAPRAQVLPSPRFDRISVGLAFPGHLFHVGVAARAIAQAPRAPAVPARPGPGTASIAAFTEHRTGVITRAFGSPKNPRNAGCG